MLLRLRDLCLRWGQSGPLAERRQTGWAVWAGMWQAPFGLPSMTLELVGLCSLLGRAQVVLDISAFFKVPISLSCWQDLCLLKLLSHPVQAHWPLCYICPPTPQPQVWEGELQTLASQFVLSEAGVEEAHLVMVRNDHRVLKC